ncbi:MULTISPECIES: DUF423 domain-containing protein [Methylomicrobium]|uniref:Uncharacterized small membrane protein n=1 Tax=Methylomicrobium album BG8 TaxID=686340 RepID=H8GIH3_METAL|nr:MULTISPECIES: DUF423 domain-containing protein [Methylomicrobium]EIC29000.1 uncharacterized small membrane protein [Methylomicrobium album BG8]
MQSSFLFFGALGALVGVGMGAFGAHGLKNMISPEMLTVYQTGVSYQMWHALGLIGIALIRRNEPESKLLNWAGWLMLTGIVLFSGSLYLLAIMGLKELGMVTPFGGVSFLLAWLLLAVYATKKAPASRYSSRSR